MTPSQRRRERRTYIELAAHLAAQPGDVERLELSLNEIQRIVGDRLPPHASFPFWWNNEGLSAHSRAWLSAGWTVDSMDKRAKRVAFARRQA